MSPRRRWALGLFVLLALASALIYCHRLGGQPAIYSLMLGIIATAFSIAVIWGLILISTGSPPTTAGARATTVVIVIAFLLKAPILISFWGLASAAGESARSCFLIGLGLVYCALVGWALARS
jgi:hypothetical protein